MGKKSKQRRIIQAAQSNRYSKVDSLLESMEDGNEYGSLVNKIPKNEDLVPELRKALFEIENIRGRPCIFYGGNVIKPRMEVGIEAGDHLIFNELINSIPKDKKELDITIVTPGGLGMEVSQFVDALRPRFLKVDFLLPYMCMSAGTLFILSGDKIWMDERSFIGPIDPQVPSKSGDLVPALALINLLNKIGIAGQENLDKGKPPPWQLVRLVDQMDQNKLGAALSLSDYSIKLAVEFLQKYKLRNWDKHKSDNSQVLEQERKEAAENIANKLCDHDFWKSHSHGINRQEAQNEVGLEIDFIEKMAGLERALRRFWALLYYVFDRTSSQKIFLSQNYIVIRNTPAI